LDDLAALGSDLCTQCGLCCAGALHDAADLYPEEVERARALGLPVRPGPITRFALPCPKLAGTVCTIYGDRPRVCGKYRCKLLRELEVGSVTFAEATARVANAKQLVNSVEEAAGPDVTLPQMRALALQEIAQTSGPSKRRAMRIKLSAVALALYLDKYFRNDRDGTIIKYQD